MSDKRWSEAHLLEKLLEELSCEQAFMMGEVMGIMRKGDEMQIKRLELRVGELERELRTISAFAASREAP